MGLDRSRFKDAPWIPQGEVYVLVGGAGGIGSWTTLLISRAGFKCVLYDFDSIEEHNMGGQLYPKRLVGKKKVVSMQEIVKDFVDEDLIIFPEPIKEDSPTNPFCIAAFDNMKARKIMFNAWDKEFGSGNNALFIDGRLEAEQLWIYCIRGGDYETINKYREILETHTDETIEEAPCTFKQTSHAAAMIAAHITGFFTNHMTNILEGNNSREVPYLWEYFIPMNLITTE